MGGKVPLHVRGVTVLALAVCLLLLMSGLATAHYLQSSKTWYPSSGDCHKNIAAIADVRDAKSYQYAYNSDCATGHNHSAGYMGVKADLYKNGAYCGSTGWYYNSSSAQFIGVGQVLCSGSGSFFTRSRNAALVSGTWKYNNADSPGHNF